MTMRRRSEGKGLQGEEGRIRDGRMRGSKPDMGKGKGSRVGRWMLKVAVKVSVREVKGGGRKK
jgi:hypothetical protein